MTLVLTSLELAVAALRRSVANVRQVGPTLPSDVQDTLRSGLVQDFEVAYEQSWKMVRRWLESNVSPDAVDGVSRRELFRRAAEAGLIDDVERWMGFHALRNETSHTYNLAVAARIVTAAPEFLVEAEQLLDRLSRRRD